MNSNQNNEKSKPKPIHVLLPITVIINESLQTQMGSVPRKCVFICLVDLALLGTKTSFEPKKYGFYFGYQPIQFCSGSNYFWSFLFFFTYMPFFTWITYTFFITKNCICIKVANPCEYHLRWVLNRCMKIC